MRDPFLFEDDDFFSPVNTGGTPAALDDLEGYYDIDSPTSPTADIVGVRPNLVYRHDTGRVYAPVTDPSASDDGEYVEIGSRLSELRLPNVTDLTGLADRQIFRYEAGGRREPRLVETIAETGVPRTLNMTTLLTEYADITKKDSYRTVYTSIPALSMRFQVDYADSIGTVVFYIRAQGIPTDSLRFKIYADDGTGKPNTSVLLGASQAVEGGEFSGAFAMVAFRFSAPIPVVTGTNYHAIPVRTGALDLSKYWQIGVDASTPTYTNGKVLTGTPWTEQDEDAIFEIWSPTSGGASGGGGGAVTDELVKVSSDDTTSGYLSAKLVSGAGITLSTLNPAGSETLEVATIGEAYVSFGSSPVTGQIYVP